MPLDRRKMSAQIGHEGVSLQVTKEDGDPLGPGAGRREGMGLRVVDHLQAVLEAAQKAVIVDQFSRGRRIDAAGTRETAQCLASRPNLQLAAPSAPDQLLGLGEEFDLPDTAPTGFDIVAFDRDSPAAAMRIDLTLDRVDVLDRREVEVLSPDEGPQFAQKALRGSAIAGDRARLDQGGAFPILPDAFVV